MTSEIRVNKLTNRIGLSTVTFADSGIGVTVTGRIDPDTDSARDLGTTSVRWRRAYVDEYYGDGSNLTGIAGVSLSNGSNNRVVTATGAAALTGESNLTFTGSILTVTNSSGASELTLVTPSANDSGVYFNDGSNATTCPVSTINSPFISFSIIPPNELKNRFENLVQQKDKLDNDINEIKNKPRPNKITEGSQVAKIIGICSDVPRAIKSL